MTEPKAKQMVERLVTAYEQEGWLFREFTRCSIWTRLHPRNEWEKQHMIYTHADADADADGEYCVVNYRVFDGFYARVSGPFNSLEAARVSWKVLSSINGGNGN